MAGRRKSVNKSQGYCNCVICTIAYTPRYRPMICEISIDLKICNIIIGQNVRGSERANRASCLIKFHFKIKLFNKK